MSHDWSSKWNFIYKAHTSKAMIIYTQQNLHILDINAPDIALISPHNKWIKSVHYTASISFHWTIKNQTVQKNPKAPNKRQISAKSSHHHASCIFIFFHFIFCFKWPALLQYRISALHSECFSNCAFFFSARSRAQMQEKRNSNILWDFSKQKKKTFQTTTK